jgi:hypothetical protein
MKEYSNTLLSIILAVAESRSTEGDTIHIMDPDNRSVIKGFPKDKIEDLFFVLKNIT